MASKIRGTFSIKSRIMELILYIQQLQGMVKVQKSESRQMFFHNLYFVQKF